MPNRIIKETICRSDSIDSLSWFEEVLFYRLIVVCDDYGRFDGRPAIIKGACLPLKDDITKKHISEAIDKLSTVGLVRGYEFQGRPYLQLTTWDCHQQIRAKKSKYPSPDDVAKNQSPGRSDTGLYTQETLSENICNQLISDDSKCPRNRESKYENRESYSRNRDAHAREAGEVRRFEEFWRIYPLDKKRHLAEQAYIGVVMDGIYTEDDLVESAKNYAEYCKITGTDKIYHSDNFLKKCVFEDYLPGKYKRPAQKKPKNSFNDFSQREYDVSYMDDLEKRLLGGG